jgi:hypothetical protein
MVRDLAVVLGAFATASALALALGAPNLGTALTFGQMAFVVAVTALIVRGLD